MLLARLPCFPSCVLLLHLVFPAKDSDWVEAWRVLQAIKDVLVPRPELDLGLVGQANGMGMRRDLLQGTKVAICISSELAELTFFDLILSSLTFLFPHIRLALLLLLTLNGLNGRRLRHGRLGCLVLESK